MRIIAHCVSLATIAIFLGPTGVSAAPFVVTLTGTPDASHTLGHTVKGTGTFDGPSPSFILNGTIESTAGVAASGGFRYPLVGLTLTTTGVTGWTGGDFTAEPVTGGLLEYFEFASFGGVTGISDTGFNNPSISVGTIGDPTSLSAGVSGSGSASFLSLLFGGSTQIAGGSLDFPVNGGAFPITIELAAASGPVVPEPSSLALLATGAIGLIGYRRRKRKQAA